MNSILGFNLVSLNYGLNIYEKDFSLLSNFLHKTKVHLWSDGYFFEVFFPFLK